MAPVNVFSWHKAANLGRPRIGRDRGCSGLKLLAMSISAHYPGRVKTPETRKPGEMFSQIARNPPRSETVVALMAIGKDICSINLPRRRVFTQPRPLAVMVAHLRRSAPCHEDYPPTAQINGRQVRVD